MVFHIKIGINAAVKHKKFCFLNVLKLLSYIRKMQI